MKHVLVLDNPTGPSLTTPPSYTTFVDARTDPAVRILLISGKVSAQDAANTLSHAEVANASSTGALELAALAMHQTHRVDAVYTNQEDLVLRAAHLRTLLNVQTGLMPQDATCFRDKVRMKELLGTQGSSVNVPMFERVWSPANVIAFIQKVGYPVVIKPSLGSASASVTVLRTDAERNAYLCNDFYSRIDEEGKCMDYSGDMIIEQFVPGSMVHINGYARNGKVEIAWPFRYINTNLGFTTGAAYGNILICANTAHHTALVNAAQNALDRLPCPEHLIFHLELFEQCGKQAGTFEYTLCEIAARRPGGSIGNLIQRCESSDAVTDPDSVKSLFQEMEFRLSCGLGLRHDRERVSRYARGDAGYCIGDLIVPLRIGKLVQVPDSNLCPVEGVTVVQVAKPGVEYSGFSINTMNTCVRFIAVSREGESVNEAQIEERLQRAHEWYQQNVVYSSV
ncbi:hypothetical protein HDU77_001045 [Chytriomyces hyalinus]|nr:hypothetical protein HDU77_001045 [Chytriomyces hyalinus]